MRRNFTGSIKKIRASCPARKCFHNGIILIVIYYKLVRKYTNIFHILDVLIIISYI